MQIGKKEPKTWHAVLWHSLYNFKIYSDYDVIMKVDVLFIFERKTFRPHIAESANIASPFNEFVDLLVNFTFYYN